MVVASSFNVPIEHRPVGCHLRRRGIIEHLLSSEASSALRAECDSIIARSRRHVISASCAWLRVENGMKSGALKCHVCASLSSSNNSSSSGGSRHRRIRISWPDTATNAANVVGVCISVIFAKSFKIFLLKLSSRRPLSFLRLRACGLAGVMLLIKLASCEIKIFLAAIDTKFAHPVCRQS